MAGSEFINQPLGKAKHESAKVRLAKRKADVALAAQRPAAEYSAYSAYLRSGS